MKPEIKYYDNYFEVIGHYDDPVLCAKLTLLSDLYAIEHREGYAKFDILNKEKLDFINNKLDFIGMTTVKFGLHHDHNATLAYSPIKYWPNNPDAKLGFTFSSKLASKYNSPVNGSMSVYSTEAYDLEQYIQTSYTPNFMYDQRITCSSSEPPHAIEMYNRLYSENGTLLADDRGLCGNIPKQTVGEKLWLAWEFDLADYADRFSNLTSGTYTIAVKTFPYGYSPSDKSTGVPFSLTVSPITYNLTNIKAIGAINGWTNLHTSKTITLVGAPNYNVPDNITVTNCTYTWTKNNNKEGTLVISNPTGNISITAAGVAI